MNLLTEELLDCQGRVTHRLVLELDGSVQVTMMSSGVTAQVDTAKRRVLTPGVHLPEEVISAACCLMVR
jgi:hypothetical protein